MKLFIYSNDFSNDEDNSSSNSNEITKALFRTGNEADDGVISSNEKLNLYLDIPVYGVDKDIYLAISVPGVTDMLYGVEASLNLKSVYLDNLNELPKFREDLIATSSFTLTLFENISPCVLPQGTYNLFTLVVDYYYGKTFKDIDFSKENYELNTFTFEIKCN